MPVAQTAFNTMIDGKLIDVAKGEKFAASSKVVKLNPQCFKPEPKGKQ